MVVEEKDIAQRVETMRGTVFVLQESEKLGLLTPEQISELRQFEAWLKKFD